MADLAPILLDMHVHQIPVMPERFADLPGVTWDDAARRMVVDGETLGLGKLFSPEALIAWMDEQAIAEAWASAPPPTYRMGLAGQAAEHWCAYLNDGLDAVAARYPARLRAMHHLPVQDPALAAGIVAASARRGVRLFSAPSSAPALSLDTAPFAGMWAALDAVGAFLLLHPGHAEDPRLDDYYLRNLVGNPHETGLAGARLALAGIPERYPGVTICLAHGGGSLPMLAGRLARGRDTDRPGLDMSVAAPTAQLARLTADCVTHDPGALALADAAYGPGHVYFGSDWPFPMGLPAPHVQLAGLAPARRASLFANRPQH